MTLSAPDYKRIIDSIYPADRPVSGILLSHSRAVADYALEIAARKHLPLSRADIETAAMLHDIGIIAVDAPGIDCRGTLSYICHGPAGADMLRRMGVDEKFALVAERHTGAGLDADEAAAAGMPPGREYMPQSVLEKLICYADCFYSKSGSNARKPLSDVLTSMQRHGEKQTARFLAMHALFG